VSITVTAVNDAPVRTTTATAPRGHAADVARRRAGNDTDVDGDALSAVLVSGTGAWHLTLNAEWLVHYHAERQLQRPDSFTYKANDGSADSNVATVNLTINAVNDAPVAANDSYSTNEDTPLTVAVRVCWLTTPIRWLTR
jgi:VCBS repeat-containing protein